MAATLLIIFDNCRHWTEDTIEKEELGNRQEARARREELKVKYEIYGDRVSYRIVRDI